MEEHVGLFIDACIVAFFCVFGVITLASIRKDIKQLKTDTAKHNCKLPIVDDSKFVDINHLLNLGIASKKVSGDLTYITCGDGSKWIGSNTYKVYMRLDLNKFN